MEFDLTRLSTRSFEQLIQALAVRHFGPGVVIFGDGADGGREATLQGKTQYSPHGTAWDGYCVFQAKFRQRPLGTGSDGSWALESLDEELEKFARQEGDRQRPDYFVFATNVVLSPGVRGTKDKAVAKLEQAKAAWGLRDYDIWDYDKLRTWLDVDREVRTRFGWITAGDVLATMLEGLDGSTPTFEQAITNYVEKSLIADRYVRLEEAGHSAEEPTALSNVFVDLPLVSDSLEESSLFLDRFLDQAASVNWDPEKSRGLQRRIVLVGGPGQGKTTLGQFACQIFRASLLAGRPQDRLSQEGREAIAAVQHACESSGLPFGRAPRFPVRVVLTDLAKALTERDRPLIAYLAELISQRVGSKVSADLFRKWLGAYPWLLVLDGLDEVPANAGRDRVMRCITEFWVDAAQVGADVLALATTRPQGYNNDFSPDRHKHLVLAELPSDRALDYGSRLAGARYGSDSERTALVVSRLTRATADPTTVHLMRSPLQVAIMTALVDRYGQPPHERWSLFYSYYDVIYQRERERDTDAAVILREYRPDIDAIHQQVGLALQVLTTHEGHSDPRLTGAQLEQVIDARLEHEGHDGPGTSAMATQIRRAAELRLVFLVGAESDRIGFEIRSLQEFMAAGALVDGPDNAVIERLRAIAPLPAWRNVFLFGAGECFVRKQHLREQILNMCREFDVDGDDVLCAAARTGARLALDLLEDRTARRQPRHHRVIAAHALDALHLADETAPLRLARCYDPNVDDLFRSRLEARIDGPDEVVRANVRRCLLGLSAAEAEWAGPLVSENLPTNEAEIMALFDELPAALLRVLDQEAVQRTIGRLKAHKIEQLGRRTDIGDFVPFGRLRTRERSREVHLGVAPGLHVRLMPTDAGMQIPASEGTEGLDASPTLAVFRAAKLRCLRVLPTVGGSIGL